MASLNDNRVLTIGHSDLAIEVFLELLRSNGVTALADVRSTPYSRFNPQFNREQVRNALCDARISYVFLGNELGARRAEPECYVNGKARYDLIAKAPLFQEGLRRIQRGVEQHRIALLCAERDPITCHRSILVCRHLRQCHISIAHILQNGALETTDQLERRLLSVAGINGADLFASTEEAIENAYDVQGDRIAFMKSSATADERAEPCPSN